MRVRVKRVEARVVTEVMAMQASTVRMLNL
jgi:hypothetical protein